MKRLSIFSIILLALFSTSFAQTDTKRKTKEFVDLRYLDESQVEVDSLQRLNLVLPVGKEDFPILIWIGGGAWSYVDRYMEMDLSRTFAEAGIAVASVGHRLSPAIWKDPKMNKGIQHPKHVEDIAAAIKWIYDHAQTYGYSTDKIFLGGFSSGAHLAALICLDESYLKKVGLSKNLIKGVIPVSGAYDIENYHEAFLNSSRPHLAEQHVEAVFGETKKERILASPTHYLENLSVPMLLIADTGIAHYTRLFEDRIRETSFRDMEVIYAYNLSHVELWKDISSGENSAYRAFIHRFIWNLL